MAKDPVQGIHVSTSLVQVAMLRSKSIVTMTLLVGYFLLVSFQYSLCVFANETNEVDYHKRYDHKVIMSHLKDGQRWYQNDDGSILLADSKKNDDDDMKSKKKTKKKDKEDKEDKEVKEDKKDEKDEKDEKKKIQKQK